MKFRPIWAERGDYREIICSCDRYWVAVLLISLGFLTVGVYMVSDSDQDIGAYIILAGSAVFVVMACLHLPSASFLGINSEGLIVKFQWRTSFFRWSAIEQFGVAEIPQSRAAAGGLQRIVGINFKDRKALFSNAHAVRLQKKLIAGFEAVLRDNYGRDCAELAEHLNQLRQQYAGEQRFGDLG